MGRAILLVGMLIGLLCTAPSPALALSDAELTAIREGFAARRDQMLAQQVKPPYPPLGKDDADHLTVWNRLDYALAAMLLNTDLEKANQAVIEATERSTKAMRNINTKKENRFHWEAPLYCRIYEFFHRGSQYYPGRLSPAAAEAIRKTCWEWAKRESHLSAAEPDKVWQFWGSENHSAMRDCSIWGIAKILKDAEPYATLRYDDGSTAAQQYAARTTYVKEYLRERMRRGLLVETASPTYSKYTLQCWYNYYDFADDPALKRLADAALAVYWTDWAQQQIGAVRGGAKSRCYQGADCEKGLADGAAALAWYYLGIGRAASAHPGAMCMATSTHRLPLVVMDIALDVEGRGVYQYQSRRLGLRLEPLSSATTSEDAETIHNILDPAFGGIVHHTYCTPEFILGSYWVAKLPLDAWSGMSSQNRWQGVIFAGDPDARIFPQCVGLNNGKTYNQYWSVQSKGALIAQKLPDKPYSKQAGEMRVWFAACLKRSEAKDWVFAEAQGAFAAARPAFGGYAWDDRHWMRCQNSTAPAILQVGRRTDYAGLDAFKSAVLACKLDIADDRLSYQALEDAGTLTFYLKSDRLPEVNGKAIDLRPSKTFDSPFLQEDWASGVLTIAKATRRLVLDVSAEP
jgi:hypothetical protein